MIHNKIDFQKHRLWTHGVVDSFDGGVTLLLVYVCVVGLKKSKHTGSTTIFAIKDEHNKIHVVTYISVNCIDHQAVYQFGNDNEIFYTHTSNLN